MDHRTKEAFEKNRRDKKALIEAAKRLGQVDLDDEDEFREARRSLRNASTQWQNSIPRDDEMVPISLAA